MFRVRFLRHVALALLTTGCAGKALPPPVPTGTTVTVETPSDGLPNDWKSVAFPTDASWIALNGAAWNAALVEARAKRFDKAIADEGPLLDPAAAQARPAPPPGRYRCRVFKLGLSANGKGVGFARFKPFYCFVAVEEKLLTFTKATGTQRPGGRLWDDGDLRMVFLGGVARGSGDPAAYGANPKQNLIGVLERVDDFRWRLVTPGQAGDARIEVMELVPDTPPPTERAQ
jgi:hypothetical protein